jgi:hypothetical protein
MRLSRKFLIRPYWISSEESLLAPRSVDLGPYG